MSDVTPVYKTVLFALVSMYTHGFITLYFFFQIGRSPRRYAPRDDAGLTRHCEAIRPWQSLTRHCEAVRPWQSSIVPCVFTEVDPHVATLLGMTRRVYTPRGGDWAVLFFTCFLTAYNSYKYTNYFADYQIFKQLFLVFLLTFFVSLFASFLPRLCLIAKLSPKPRFCPFRAIFSHFRSP